MVVRRATFGLREVELKHRDGSHWTLTGVSPVESGIEVTAAMLLHEGPVPPLPHGIIDRGFAAGADEDLLRQYIEIADDLAERPFMIDGDMSCQQWFTASPRAASMTVTISYPHEDSWRSFLATFRMLWSHQKGHPDQSRVLDTLRAHVVSVTPEGGVLLQALLDLERGIMQENALLIVKDSGNAPATHNLIRDVMYGEVLHRDLDKRRRLETRRLSSPAYDVAVLTAVRRSAANLIELGNLAKLYLAAHGVR